MLTLDFFFFSDRRYYLERIINIEQNTDPKKGNRFLLELQLGLYGSDLSFRLSDYIFVPNEEKELCFPIGMQWESSATVYFVLPVKNQGKWLHHFASQLINTSKETSDLKFHVIIIDFESQDIDIIIIIIIIKAYTALIQTVLSALQFINSIKYNKT